MPYFAYIVGGWVQKEGKFCLRNKSMAPYDEDISKTSRKKISFAILWCMKKKENALWCVLRNSSDNRIKICTSSHCVMRIHFYAI